MGRSEFEVAEARTSDVRKRVKRTLTDADDDENDGDIDDTENREYEDFDYDDLLTKYKRYKDTKP